VQQAGVLGDVGEHRRAVEVAGAVELLAPDEDLRALLRRVLDEPGHLAALVVVDERPDLHVGVRAAADRQVAHALGEALGEVPGDRAGDVEAVRTRAGLADVAHLGDHRPLDRRVEVRVVEDEERRVAAQLHRDAQDLLGGLLDERAPDLGRAGEGQLARARVADERLHDLA
jgi:ParB family chromosome partitioning protein